MGIAESTRAVVAVFAYGDAGYSGSAATLPLASPIVGIQSGAQAFVTDAERLVPQL